VDDRLTLLEKTARFRQIDLHWCLTLEPSTLKAFERKPQENSANTSRMLAELQKSTTILEGYLGSLLGLRLLDSKAASSSFPISSILRNGPRNPSSATTTELTARSSAIQSNGTAIISASANATGLSDSVSEEAAFVEHVHVP
jgi:hypothetical protein